MSFGPGETSQFVARAREEIAASAARPADRNLQAQAALPQEYLFDSLLEASTEPFGPAGRRLEQFLSERSVAKALRLWLGSTRLADKEQLVLKLNRDVAHIDRLLNEQINAILHHPAFQRLEAAWRGLAYLAGHADGQAAEGVEIKLKILSVSWKELERDFERAVDFDTSNLFRKVYEAELGMPGGEPFAVLIGDYQIHPRPAADHPHDDTRVLKSLSQIAAAAFCPFVANASPAMFGLDDFAGLEQQLNYARTFEQLDYLTWRAFRDTEDARFVGLTLPRMLMRLPYEDHGSRVDRFRFREDVSGRGHEKYLWGGAAFAFAAVLMRAFADAGWLADIRGVRRGVDGGGLVTGLPVHSFNTDKSGVALKCSTDVIITDQLEKELSDLGFIPLCHCHDTEYSAFYSNQSVQKPKKYDRPAATRNARISAMLQYMLCVSRFAHYIKILGRDKIGAFAEAEDFEKFLQDWIVQYVTVDDEASPEVKAEFPLRDARVQVRASPGKSGWYQCVIHLLPHYELEELKASVRLVTELVPARTT